VSPAKLYRLPWVALRQLMAKEPEFQLNLLMKLAHDFRQAQRQMMILGQQNAKQRLALFLLDFMRNPVFFEPGRAMLTLPISRSDLADYLGTTRETTTRALISLERQGLLQRVGGHAIKILDPKGLKHLQYGSFRERTKLHARSRATSVRAAE
jgi:CRP/FNR family transcriptional regulator